jgi:hypothetical protein
MISWKDPLQIWKIVLEFEIANLDHNFDLTQTNYKCIA